MSSLSDGLMVEATGFQLQDEFLHLALERYPGEFWVHIRKAFRPQLAEPNKRGDEKAIHETMLRHMTAAVAARPRSAVARAILGVTILEKNRDDPTGKRILQSAAEVDPTSPWPHLFLGMMAAEQGDWSGALPSFKRCVQADPDTGFYMVSIMTGFMFDFAPRRPSRPTGPTESEIEAFVADLVAARPEHPGGYYMLAQHQLKKGDARAALATFRKANALSAPDFPGRPLIGAQIQQLESLAKWEPKVEAVLRGDLKLANQFEIADFATYCATFDKKYVLAARFFGDSVKTEPALLDSWTHAGKFAGYAVQASFGNGADAAKLTPDERRALRKQALAWLRETVQRSRKNTVAILGDYFYSLDDLAPVRESKQRAMLPTDEQDEWIAFWLDVAPKMSDVKPRKTDIELAPPPRAAKRP
jgi:hypothetical protein